MLIVDCFFERLAIRIRVGQESWFLLFEERSVRLRSPLSRNSIDADLTRRVSPFPQTNSRLNIATPLSDYRPPHNRQTSVSVYLAKSFQLHRPLRPFKYGRQGNIRLPRLIIIHSFPFHLTLMQLDQVDEVVLVCIACIATHTSGTGWQIAAYFLLQRIDYGSDAVYVLTGLVMPAVTHSQCLFFIVNSHLPVVDLGRWFNQRVDNCGSFCRQFRLLARRVVPPMLIIIVRINRLTDLHRRSSHIHPLYTRVRSQAILFLDWRIPNRCETPSIRDHSYRVPPNFHYYIYT